MYYFILKKFSNTNVYKFFGKDRYNILTISAKKDIGIKIGLFLDIK